MVRLLEESGFSATTIKATHTYDVQTLKSAWSHRSAARIANMGQFGVNRMLITKRGCAGRYGTVITSAHIPLDDEAIHDYCLYHRDGSCTECIEACPVEALAVNTLDKFRCHETLLQNAAELVDIGNCDVCGKCVVACPVACMK